MDRSHDSRSAADAAARREEIDPWSEFLSETSEELQQLQGTHLGSPQPGTAVEPPPPAVDAAPIDENRPPPPAAPPDSSAASGWPSESPPAAPVEPEPRPAAPRDGAPPFTRRISYGRPYESQFPGVASAPPAAAAPPVASHPAPDIPTPAPEQPVVRPANLDQASPLFAPEPPPVSRSSIWKTSPDGAGEQTLPLPPEPRVPPLVRQPDPAPITARDEPPPVAARDHLPVAGRADVSSGVPPDEAASSVGRDSGRGRALATERPTAQQPADSLPLSDVLARHTPVHWSEAVATIEELCATIDAGSSAPVPVPDLTDVFITAQGGVAVRQGAGGDPDAAALGRALHTLLGTGNTPLPLRLFVTSAVSSGRYSSVRVFADALSYYALPDRTQLIQALHRRAAERTAPRPVATARTTTVTPLPLLPAATNRGRMTKIWTIAVAAGIVAAAVTGVWIWSARVPAGVGVTAPGAQVVTPPTPKRSEDWAPGPILVEGARPAVAPARPAPSSQFARRNDVTAGSRTAPPPSAPATRSIPPPPPAAVNVRPAPAAVTQSSPAVTPVPAAPVDTGANGASATPPTPASAVPPVARPPVVVDTHVYSDADLDVEAPVMLSPVPFVTQNMTVELLISPTGEVRSARLMERPQQLTDGTVLQPAKLWKFRPATKEGRPVSYRYRLRLLAAAN